jgi:hypothetical protein
LRTGFVKNRTEQTSEDHDYNERNTSKPVHRNALQTFERQLQQPVPKGELTTTNSRCRFRRAAIAYRAYGEVRRRTTIKPARIPVRISRLFSETSSRTGSIGWFPRRWPGFATEDKASM